MDYAPIEAFLVGRCGKTLREAAMTSYYEFELLYEGHAEQEHERWERLRWEVYMQWAISPNLKRRPRKPQDVIRFPWENHLSREIENAEPLTEVEIEQLSKIFGIDRKQITNG